ncbi:hypothetical protein [Spiroplasma turonicum]|uniref:Uncharacterized protein n=1 Tax=Spiroplasma turonicum TaxID=216946 RepID=A0A0K1P6J6_9MOLU|nr:hypothetical protein [Spiroplasma turonicum]AKU79928.1 hypothetical protein STURON_00682 [Spiroplasma turonicum]ALX70942.1 hypothetical protein STURO_v1c06830 [Spiroplasma turonicum]
MIKNNFISFMILFNLVFKNIFLSLKTYIYCFVLSSFLFILFLFFNYNINYNLILPPLLMNLFCISIFCTSFYIGLVIIEWKKRMYLLKLKLGEINVYNFGVVLIILNSILFILSFLLNLLIFSILINYDILIIDSSILGNLNSFVFSIFFLNLILLIIFLTVIVLLISSIFTKSAFNIIFLIVFILMTVLFSDTLLDPNLFNQNMFYIIIGYLNPAKYFIWTGMLFTSYTFYDFYGITQIIEKYFQGSFSPFTNIYSTIIPSIAFIVLSIFLYIKFFKWGVKK